MVDAVVGSVIMVLASTSLLLALEVAEGAFDQAGYQPLSVDEQLVIEKAIAANEGNGVMPASAGEFECMNTRLFLASGENCED